MKMGKNNNFIQKLHKKWPFTPKSVEQVWSDLTPEVIRGRFEKFSFSLQPNKGPQKQKHITLVSKAI